MEKFKVKVLTPSEASSLAYLAEVPNCENWDEVFQRLGPEAQKIALGLKNQLDGKEPAAQAAADGLKEWARERRLPDRVCSLCNTEFRKYGGHRCSVTGRWERKGDPIRR